MKNVLIVSGLVLALVVGLGFYKGWFHFASDSGGGKSNVTFTVDTDWIRADEKRAVGAVKDPGHPSTTKATPPTEQK